MRTLGDLNWINDYVGKIPYKFGGRDWDGVDCYGLAKLVYKEVYDIDLPDWVMDELDLKTRDSLIAKAVCSGEFTEVDDPMDGDFVVCSRTRMSHHLGFTLGVFCMALIMALCMNRSHGLAASM